MKKYHVYGIGNALLDRDALVNDELLHALAIEKNVKFSSPPGAHPFSPDTQRTSRGPDMGQNAQN